MILTSRQLVSRNPVGWAVRAFQMFRAFFRWLRSLWNSQQTSDEETVATKLMDAGSLLLFNRLAGKNVFDGYSVVFTTFEEIDLYVESYFEQPRPERWVSAMLEFLGSQRELPGQCVTPLTGFLSEVTDANPERVSEWRSVAKKGNQAIGQVFDEASMLNRPKILSMANHSAALNDLYWGGYHASGSTQYIGKVIDQLEYFDERFDEDLFAAGASAKWSLACHAGMSPSVRACVLETRPSRNARIQELLDEILSIDPSEVEEEIRAILAQQEEDGGWD